MVKKAYGKEYGFQTGTEYIKNIIADLNRLSEKEDLC